MKVSLAALIDRAKEVRSKKTALLFIPSLDGEITIIEPDYETYTDAVEMDSGNDEYLIYNCVTEPRLRDAELQKAYACSEPTDIVRKIFANGEIKQITGKILELGGYRNTVKVVEEIKN